MDFHGVKQALSSDYDLLRLFFERQRSYECGHFFGCLPLCQLSETLLSGPHGGVNDLQEQLSGARIEDEDRSVDRLGHKIAFESLVSRHAIHIRVINKPDLN